ncbi:MULTISPECIES: DivIVA domain-containing protein [Streptomycetaceae]|uniref:Secreted protein n=1 Tax=Streptantibioticus cattleyicolor (strain ATCC 35852 / DSM 46488 / JCM 4925 / NBRC 14057 / NRRL 8057) TaxID=1003195 RepID=F8K3N3_STREN|nr:MULTISPECIES: DivIVA domain-containing protein [Streptomycetaceae]AEW96355.1 secreted protein [Streptantibioticus cattleyicolor NRRL 8057 = DSM 46488]MYS60869.1 DivIVA domain-containing protein [Streptomyces sp. SID5468]CCB76695.1 Secreted protein [Streptantibioticus cattleyicolor NRRL 8057 = DSM 46488]
MFWFMLIALVAVVAAVALAVLGDGGTLPETEPDLAAGALPADRPTARADLEELRLPVALRGYRMTEVDDVLDRLGAELAERDARIAELEAALAGAHDAALGGRALGEGHPPAPEPGGPPGAPDAGAGDHPAGGEEGRHE